MICIHAALLAFTYRRKLKKYFLGSFPHLGLKVKLPTFLTETSIKS